jgi:hypothetical protein
MARRLRQSRKRSPTGRGRKPALRPECDGVERPHISQEALVIEAWTKEFATSMLKRISDRPSRSVSESIDRVGRNLGSETRLQTFAADYIDRMVEHVGDKIFHAGIIDNRHDDRGIEIDQDVDIAVRAVIAARDGTEQRGVGDALRSQVCLALFQFFYDLVACHELHYTAKRVKNTFSFASLRIIYLWETPLSAGRLPAVHIA